MHLSKLKKGDEIIVEFGEAVHKAKVIENFPLKEKIYIKVNTGIWYLFNIKTLRSYSSYNFNLIRE